MKLLPLIIASLLLLILGCEGPAGPSGVQGEKGTNGTNASSDKQIRLMFPGVSHTASDTAGFVLPPNTHIFKFNKAHYPLADSIIFIGLIRTNDTAAVCVAEVFNATDTVAIANSKIQTKSTTQVSVESKNFFANLPNKEITLGVRLSSTRQGVSVGISQTGLYLYRK